MAEGPSEPKPSAGRGIPTEVPKPYTIPEGYVAPKMSELWLYVRLSLLVPVALPARLKQPMASNATHVCVQANKTHPYYRYGYSLALGVGLVAGAYAWYSRQDKPSKATESS